MKNIDANIEAGFESNNMKMKNIEAKMEAGFESNNIKMKNIDAKTGLFSSSSDSGNAIYIQHNGQDIAESKIHSHIYTTGSFYTGESGGRSVILHLEKDDVVSVRVDSVCYLYYTTFCISYEGAS